MHHFKDFVLNWMPYVLSFIGVFMIVKAGDMKRVAWLIGLAAQVLWFIWINVSGNYGFLIQNFALVVAYTRNYYKWREVGVAK